MAKEGKPYFFIALIVVVIVLIINAAYLIHKSGGLPNGITGFSIDENLLNSYESLPQLGKIFIISEISFLFLMLLIVIIRDITINRYKTKTIEVHIKRNNDPAKTDIDVLYDALRDKKELNISTIAQAFDIDKETVLEWAQILESGDLAIIEYPGFSEPVVRLSENELKKINIKRSDVTKDSKIIKKEITKETPVKTTPVKKTLTKTTPEKTTKTRITPSNIKIIKKVSVNNNPITKKNNKNKIDLKSKKFPKKSPTSA